MIRRFAPVMFGVFLVSAANGGAQVGHQPARSPYHDLEYAQEIGLVFGPYHAHRDAANVAPGGGPLVGVHYEWRAGGPAHLIADVSRIQSDRRVLNPFAIGTARELGTSSRALYSANVGLGLSLTGAKSWHGFVPELAGGLGFVSNFRSKPDSGGFKFGTRFALNWGGGIRWVPGGRWQVRGDLTNRMYTVAYPEAFYIAPAGGSAVLESTVPKSSWMNNPAFTLGLSRLF